LRLLIAASIALATVACSDKGEFDRRISSPDENYASELASRLDAAGIDFRAPRDGSIAYRSRDENIVRSIEERLKQEAAVRAPNKR
jgi:hypothetical protein